MNLFFYPTSGNTDKDRIVRDICDHDSSGSNDSTTADCQILQYSGSYANMGFGTDLDAAAKAGLWRDMTMFSYDAVVFDDCRSIDDDISVNDGVRIDDTSCQQLAACGNFLAPVVTAALP